jgi:hypothetical protein
MKNSILIRRKNMIIVEDSSTKDIASSNVLAIVLKNIESLGFSFNEEVISKLKEYSESELKDFYLSTVDILKDLVGAKYKFAPMYPNFPEQVLEMSDSELYINAMIHYVGIIFGENWLPESEVKERFPLIDTPKLKVLSLGTDSDFHSVIRNLVGANSSISGQDKSDLTYYVENFSDMEVVSPEVIPYKENLTYFTSLMLKYKRDCKAILNRYYSTATDVLRLAVALSDGDVSLAKDSKFKSFGRSGRKLLLGLLNNVKNADEDMLKYASKWKRLGERLHPGDYKRQYPRAIKYFDNLRNGVKLKKFMGEVELLIKSGESVKAAELLKSRPGVFARKLDQLLRTANNQKMVVNYFSEVVSSVATPVLLQVKSHFNVRDRSEKRIVFPKGNATKLAVIDNELKPMGDITHTVVDLIDNALKERFKELESLGKVYIDESLSKYLVPFSQRSASAAYKTVVRGSRVKVEGESNFIRLFMYWKNISVDSYHSNTRVDLDLSAGFFNDDFTEFTQVSYTNLREGKMAYHSGDITNAPRGASEFIDINIEQALKNGYKYVSLNVYSFTHQNFSDMDISYVGWMMRDDLNSGEIYEPKTVVNTLDLTTESTNNMPVLFDLENREIIYCDMGGKLRAGHVNNIHTDRTLNLYCKTMSELHEVKSNLYDLFKLHAVSRGTLVDDVKDADLAFLPEVIDVQVEGDAKAPVIATPYDLDDIMAKYLV